MSDDCPTGSSPGSAKYGMAKPAAPTAAAMPTMAGLSSVMAVPNSPPSTTPKAAESMSSSSLPFGGCTGFMTTARRTSLSGSTITRRFSVGRSSASTLTRWVPTGSRSM